MSPEMNPFIRSRSDDRRWFITHVGIFALAVAFHFSLQLPFSAIAVSWKEIYIRGISIMIQLQVAEASPERMYKVVWVIGWVLEQEALFCASHVMTIELRILAVC